MMLTFAEYLFLLKVARHEFFDAVNNYGYKDQDDYIRTLSQRGYLNRAVSTKDIGTRGGFRLVIAISLTEKARMAIDNYNTQLRSWNHEAETLSGVGC